MGRHPKTKQNKTTNDSSLCGHALKEAGRSGKPKVTHPIAPGRGPELKSLNAGHFGGIRHHTLNLPLPLHTTQQSSAGEETTLHDGHKK